MRPTIDKQIQSLEYRLKYHHEDAKTKQSISDLIVELYLLQAQLKELA